MEELTVLEWVLLAVAAFVTAIMSTVAGVGGGSALVGVMAAFLPPVAVVPVHGVVQLASNSTRVLAFLSKVSWPLYWRIGPALVVGALISREILVRFFEGERFTFLRVVVGAFLLAFLVFRRVRPSVRTPPLWVYVPVAVATGAIGIFVGALGPFLSPFLLRDDLEKEEIIATSAICMGTGHLLKIPVFLSIGFPFAKWIPLIALCVGCVVAGTLVGKKLLAKLDPVLFIRLVEGLLLVLGIWLCASWAWATFGAAPIVTP